MDGYGNTTGLLHPHDGQRPAHDISDGQRVIVDRLIEQWVDEAKQARAGHGERDGRAERPLAHAVALAVRRLVTAWAGGRGRDTSTVLPAAATPGPRRVGGVRPACDGQP